MNLTANLTREAKLRLGRARRRAKRIAAQPVKRIRGLAGGLARKHGGDLVLLAGAACIAGAGYTVSLGLGLLVTGILLAGGRLALEVGESQ